ncbi:hypothetical protein BKA70DRAFT_1450281 [Coprinopsis sp. MPI-PUGE-AT-0042]|nr:hypothetical protein BKA70DRAFT_1450281 [Coprinopsis sp. MPI-PUGE-AT-0042]
MGPMRRVPPEVLASIIHFAIAGRCGYVSDKGCAIFLDIRSVCRLWRTTAFSTPSLWRAIERDLTARHWRKPSIWNCLASWFSHAGEGAPLQVNVAVAVPYHAIDLFEFLSKSGLNITFLDISSAHTSGHWEYSSLEFLSESYEKPLLIKHLIIKSQNRPTDPPQSFRSIPLVDNFPHLQHLQLLQSQLNSPPSDISLPTLPLQFSTFTIGLPRLSNLFLDDCETQLPDSPSNTYTHPSLAVLKFFHNLPEDLLACLAFPSLQWIIIHGCHASLDNLEYGLVQVLGALLERCGGQIKAELLGTFPRQLVHDTLRNNTTLTRLQLPGPSHLYTDVLASSTEDQWKLLFKSPSLRGAPGLDS